MTPALLESKSHKERHMQCRRGHYKGERANRWALTATQARRRPLQDSDGRPSPRRLPYLQLDGTASCSSPATTNFDTGQVFRKDLDVAITSSIMLATSCLPKDALNSFAGVCQARVIICRVTKRGAKLPEPARAYIVEWILARHHLLGCHTKPGQAN